jgi:hypothetical protein
MAAMPTVAVGEALLILFLGQDCCVEVVFEICSFRCDPDQYHNNKALADFAWLSSSRLGNAEATSPAVRGPNGHAMALRTSTATGKST